MENDLKKRKKEDDLKKMEKMENDLNKKMKDGPINQNQPNWL
jgi:hypothetical protein